MPMLQPDAYTNYQTQFDAQMESALGPRGQSYQVETALKIMMNCERDYPGQTTAITRMVERAQQGITKFGATKMQGMLDNWVANRPAYKAALIAPTP